MIDRKVVVCKRVVSAKVFVGLVAPTINPVECVFEILCVVHGGSLADAARPRAECVARYSLPESGGVVQAGCERDPDAANGLEERKLAVFRVTKVRGRERDAGIAQPRTFAGQRE